MKPFLITLVVAFVTTLGGTLAVLASMNNACKTGRHAWCASDLAELRTARRLAFASCSARAGLSEPQARRACRDPDVGHALVFAAPPQPAR